MYRLWYFGISSYIKINKYKTELENEKQIKNIITQREKIKYE